MRSGVAQVFCEVEPLAGRRHVELSALQTQCLDRRIPDKQLMQAEITSWEC